MNTTTADVTDMAASLFDTPSELSFNAIREYADKISDHYEVIVGDGSLDLDALVVKLGGTVVAGSAACCYGCHVDANIGDMACVRGLGDFTISHRTGPGMTARRKRFSVAHELSRYTLCYVYTKQTQPFHVAAGISPSLQQTQANVFASTLLMPSKSFTNAWQTHKGSHVKLSKIFDVSPNMVLTRSRTLEL